MLPQYIEHEIMRRLPAERTRLLARELGIDVGQHLPDIDPQFEDEYAFSGSLQFDLTIGALGRPTSSPCRLYFNVDLENGYDEESGQTVRVLGKFNVAFYVHVATGQFDHVFEWTKFDGRLLPAASLAKLMEQVEELAVIMEGGRATGL